MHIAYSSTDHCSLPRYITTETVVAGFNVSPTGRSDSTNQRCLDLELLGGVGWMISPPHEEPSTELCEHPTSTQPQSSLHKTKTSRQSRCSRVILGRRNSRLLTEDRLFLWLVGRFTWVASEGRSKKPRASRRAATTRLLGGSTKEGRAKTDTRATHSVIA